MGPVLDSKTLFSPFEKLLDGSNRLPLQGGQNVGIRLQGNGDMAMAHKFLSYLRMHVFRQNSAHYELARSQRCQRVMPDSATGDTKVRAFGWKQARCPYAD